MVFIDMPLIFASFWSITAFYMLAHRELYPKSWKRGIFFIPVADGGRGCAYDQQYARGIGSSLRRADGVRAYSEICDRRRSEE